MRTIRSRPTFFIMAFALDRPGQNASTAMTTPTTRIALFGALEITHGSAAALRPPTQRVLALLGYLIAYHGVPQGRDKLVDLLWPDLGSRQGRRLLSDALWRARRLLTLPGHDDTPTLAIVGDTVTFRPTPETSVDLIEFERQLKLADTAAAGADEHLRAAAELYRGDFLEECYDDWALFERERLRERYLGALGRLLEHDQGRGAYDLALQSALRLTRADPLREETHRALMRIYHLLGRTDDALRAYQQCRTVLQAELGIEPDPATISLYEELAALQQRRGGVGKPAGGTDGALLLQNVPLVGRVDARAEVMDAVEAALAGAGGLVLVVGEAGQGKSRLLREIAAGAEWRGAQTSWGRGREDAAAQPLGPLREALLSALTPLRARQIADLLPPYTLDSLLSLIPELIDLLPEHATHPSSGEPTAARLHATLASVLQVLAGIAPQVLLLEDLHWFDAATLEALEATLPALRAARILLAVSARSEELTRRPAAWDAALRLDRTGLLRRVELAGLSEDEVGDLVRRALRLRQPAPRFAARLAAATGGNPFFVLETLRALIGQGTLTRDAQGNWHTPWDSPATDYHELPLPVELRQAIARRISALAPVERRALAAAAVLGQSFAPNTLARMTGDATANRSASRTAAPSAPPLFPHAPGAVADQLLRRQFLAEDGGAYRFEHHLLREVIYEHLDDRTRQSLHQRAAEALEQEHYARVEALAQHLYLAGAWDRAVPYLLQAGDRARDVCAYRDAQRYYDQAADAASRTRAEATRTSSHWDIQLRRGDAATTLGDYPAAIEAYQAVLRLVERDAAAPDAAAGTTERRRAQIQALSGLSFVYGQRNDYAMARQAVGQAMRLADESPRLVERAEAYYQAGLISFRGDDYGEARRYLEEALRLYDALGHDAERAKCLVQIGFSRLRQEGPTDDVIAHFTQALEIYRQRGDRFAEHSCMGDIAGAYLTGGRLPEVVRTVDQCLAFFRSVGALDDVSACLFMRGEALRRMGRPDEALEALSETLALCEQMSRDAAAAFSRVRLAAALRDLGRRDEALAILEPALGASGRTIAANALLVAANVWRDKRQLDRAWDSLAQCLELARQVGSRSTLGAAYRLLGQLRQADKPQQLPVPTDDAPSAQACFENSARLLREAHSDDELALTLAAQAGYLAATGHVAEARAALLHAQTLMSRCGMAVAAEQAQQALAALPATATLMPGQRRVLLARRGTPRGRPLRPDELVEVVWSVDAPAERELGQAANKVAARQERLMRLCSEALAQGGEPTVGDLAEALGVTPRTVDRDIAALRAGGAALATRGTS
jgi:DNA-binding SARP family transcriptional activator